MPAPFSAELSSDSVGPVTLWTTFDKLVRIELRRRPEIEHTPPGERPAVLDRAVTQVGEYFRGERRRFDLPVELPKTVTAFQRAVYDELGRIEFGALTTYGDLARDLGSPDSARAVGQAVGANPIPLVIPCHRVVGARGRLTGFGSGVPNKVRLLALEGVVATGELATSSVELRT